jgi:hypothetical protein
VRRYAVRGQCPSCRALILRGLDGDLAAVEVTVDLEPLGAQGEALAQLGGRQTFALARRGTHYRLTRRDHWQIGGRRGTTAVQPGRTAADVLAEHRCGTAALPAVPSALAPPTTTQEATSAHHPSF